MGRFSFASKIWNSGCYDHTSASEVTAGTSEASAAVISEVSAVVTSEMLAAVTSDVRVVVTSEMVAVMSHEESHRTGK